MYKDEWKDKAVKLASLWLVLLAGGKDAPTFGDLLAMEGLTSTAREVLRMLRDDQGDPDDETLHEMMEQAAREMCDE